MNVYVKMGQAHSIIEEHGGERRERVFAEMQAGVPILYTTEFDGENLRVKDQEVLPARLAGPMMTLCEVRDHWLAMIYVECPRRSHNIAMGLETLERLLSAIKGRAIGCTGTRYVITTIANILSGTMYRLANLSHYADGTDVDAELSAAGLRINDLLRAAGCKQPLPRAA